MLGFFKFFLRNLKSKVFPRFQVFSKPVCIKDYKGPTFSLQKLNLLLNEILESYCQVDSAIQTTAEDTVLQVL